MSKNSRPKMVELCTFRRTDIVWGEVFLNINISWVAELQDLTDHSAFKRQLQTFLFERTFTTW